jgi:hypothetical protein
MTYEEKYKKYKQKYLNLLSKINVLKGGDGEEEYRQGLAALEQCKIVEAVRLFELAVKKNNMDAMNYLFDIYYFGRLGVPKNFDKCIQIKAQLKAAEAYVSASAPFMTQIHGIESMERCFLRTDSVQITGAHHFAELAYVNSLLNDGIHNNDPRLKFLRFALTGISYPPFELDPNHELSLNLLSRTTDRCRNSEIPARRGIIEAMYTRGRLLLEPQHFIEHQKDYFIEARSLFLKIHQSTGIEPYYRERVAVSLIRLGVNVQPSADLQRLELTPDDVFIFDISNIDSSLRIAADICSNLLLTQASVERRGRTCIIGEAVQSHRLRDLDSTGAVSALPTEYHLSFPVNAGIEGIRSDKENPSVDITISEAILYHAVRAKGEGRRRRFFIFSGDGNDRLDGLINTHDPGFNPHSIYGTVELCTARFSFIDFVIVSLDCSLSSRYRVLASQRPNLNILTLQDFIQGSMSEGDFLPLTSRDLRDCVTRELPEGWTKENRGGVIYYIRDLGKIEVRQDQLPRCARYTKLSTLLLQWYENTQTSASGKFSALVPEFKPQKEMAAASSGMAAASSGMAAASSRMAAASSGMAAASSGMATVSSGMAAASATRIPPNWGQDFGGSFNSKIKHRWWNFSTSSPLGVCPEKVEKEQWKAELQQISKDKHKSIVSRQLKVCYCERKTSCQMIPRAIDEAISHICNVDLNMAIDLLFNDEELNKFFAKIVKK